MALAPEATAYLYENVGFNTPLAREATAYLYENVGFDLGARRGVGPIVGGEPSGRAFAYCYEGDVTA
jgi:hypothetical protein